MVKTIIKKTILKEVLRIGCDPGSDIQLEVAQLWFTLQEARINPAYFYHPGLRWFSHLLYTCQNQCNKMKLNKKDFFFKYK